MPGFPVSAAQYLCLARDADPDCRDDTRARWVLANATLVQPGVDMRRLRRALTQLVARHDCLRTRFQVIKGQFRAIIAPAGPADIREIELGQMDDVTFRTRITEIANAPLPLMGQPLAELILVHCAGRGDVVVWRAHHAITDGFGMVVLFEDMLKLLLGMPLLSRPVTYPDYVARFLTPSPARAAKITAFWKDMHRDLPKAPNIGRKANGLEPLWCNMGDVVGKRLRVRVSGDSLTGLRNRTARGNLSFASVMFTGFLETLCQLYDTDRLAFTTLIARSDPALSTFAGAHYFDPVLPYRAAGRDGIDQAARQLRADLMLASEHLPSDAACQATDYEKALVAQGIYPRQFSVHQPRPTSRMEKSVFSDGLRAGPGVPQRLGPYVLTSLDVSVFHRCRSDLRLLLREGHGKPGFDLHYDGLSYTDDEVAAIGAGMCDLLSLDPDGAVLV